VSWIGWQVREFVERWRVPVEDLLQQTGAIVVQACDGIIDECVDTVSGKLSARFKAEVLSVLKLPASFLCESLLRSMLDKTDFKNFQL